LELDWFFSFKNAFSAGSFATRQEGLVCNMQCPYCASSSFVTNSRPTAKGTQIWRRRECSRCHSIWSTKEAVDLSKTHVFIAPESNPQPFSRDALFISLTDSLKHRKSGLSDATALTDTILGLVLAQKSPKISRDDLIELAYQTLKRFDKVAAEVYKSTHS